MKHNAGMAYGALVSLRANIVSSSYSNSGLLVGAVSQPVAICLQFILGLFGARTPVGTPFWFIDALGVVVHRVNRYPNGNPSRVEWHDPVS